MWVERLAWDAIIAWEAYSFGEIFSLFIVIYWEPMGLVVILVYKYLREEFQEWRA